MLIIFFGLMSINYEITELLFTCVSVHFGATVLRGVLHAHELEVLKAVEGEAGVGHHSHESWDKASVQGADSTFLENNITRKYTNTM